MENEKNEFEKGTSANIPENDRPTYNEQLKREETTLQERTAEGVTAEGQTFSSATKTEAEASMTNRFFNEASENQSTASEQLQYPSQENIATSGNNGGSVPPVPPTRQSELASSGGGGKPPRNGKHWLGYFLTGLIGVLIGALIVFLVASNLNSGNSNDSNSGNNASSTPTKVEKVSYQNTTDTTKAVSKVQDAVVSVLNYQASTSLDGGTTSEQQASSGSGVVYKKANGKAYVVTNNHVVSGANKIEVTFSNGKKAKAKLVGTDVWNDLAVLEISDKNVTKVAEFGDSNALKVGETAIAIGSPLSAKFAGSVTQGIISGLNRTVPVDTNGDGKGDWEAEVIQTDAAINPGNSGGALINLEGQVIGINSMKISTANVEGIGFAIPINAVQPVIEQLEKNGEVVRPSLGVTLRDIETIPEAQQQTVLKLPEKVNFGAMIQQVIPGSSADKAGLKQFDVIVEMNGKKITNSITLRKVLYNNNLKIGETVKVKYYREGKEKSTEIKLQSAKTTQE